MAIFPEVSAIPGASPARAIPTLYDDTLFTIKVDQRMSGRQSMLYRFSLQQNSSPNDQVANPAATDLNGGNTNANDLYSVVAKHSLT